MKVVVVDSYDSFTYNLVGAFESLGARVVVVPADQTEPTAVLALEPTHMVLGPGPGNPEDASGLLRLIYAVAGNFPILGVCLGHQALALSFGGAIIRHHVVHGRATPIHHTGEGLFAGLPEDIEMTRYHSLAVDPLRLPSSLRVTAWSDDGAIMGFMHRQLPILGLQFHPESVLSTQHGPRLLSNFLKLRNAPLPWPLQPAGPIA